MIGLSGHSATQLFRSMFCVSSRPKRKCFGFFGSQQVPGLASSQFRESKFASRVACANTVIGVWCNFFSPLVRFREERASLWGMMVWCELLLHFNTVQPWSGLHVSERKSSGMEVVGTFFGPALTKRGKWVKAVFPFMPIFSPVFTAVLRIVDISHAHFKVLKDTTLCSGAVYWACLHVLKRGVGGAGQQEAADRLVWTLLVQESGALRVGDKQTG